MPLLSILLGTTTGSAVGALWYSPVMFNKPFMTQGTQISEDQIKKWRRCGVPVNILSNLALAGTLDHALPVMDLGDTWKTLAMVAGGFTIMSVAMEAGFYPLEDRSFKQFAINTGYNTTRITLITAVLLFLRN